MVTINHGINNTTFDPFVSEHEQKACLQLAHKANTTERNSRAWLQFLPAELIADEEAYFQAQIALFDAEAAEGSIDWDYWMTHIDDDVRYYASEYAAWENGYNE